MIFTMFLMAMFWANDFAVLMWDLDLDKAVGNLPPSIIFAVWCFCMVLDVSELLRSK